MKITRQDWLNMVKHDVAAHPGRVSIMGYEVDLASPEETKLALLWVSLQTSELFSYMAKQMGAHYDCGKHEAP